MAHTRQTRAQLLASLAAAEAQLAALRAREGDSLRDPNSAEEAIRSRFPDLDSREQESFFVVLLDSRLKVLAAEEIHRGSVSMVEAHPRECFRSAVRMGAHSIVLAHNHPSGDPEPSQADLDLTHRFAEAGRILGIPVLDHLILARGGRRTSLAARGLV